MLARGYDVLAILLVTNDLPIDKQNYLSVVLAKKNHQGMRNSKNIS